MGPGPALTAMPRDINRVDTDSPSPKTQTGSGCRITSKNHRRTAPSTTGSARTWRDQELADELVAEEDGDLDAAEERFQEEAKGRDTYEAGHPRPS